MGQYCKAHVSRKMLYFTAVAEDFVVMTVDSQLIEIGSVQSTALFQVAGEFER